MTARSVRRLLAVALAAAVAGPAAAADPAPITHHKATANGVRLHYLRAGAGPETVVLLHGWPQTSHEWRHVIPRLADKYAVLAPDLRGFGDSDKPAGGYDKKTVAEDVYQLVTGLGVKRAHVVGHDVGSMVAFALAAYRPDAVKTLTITEVLIPGFGLEDALDVGKGGYWHMGFHMAPDIPEMLVEGKERKYLAAMMRPAAYNPAAVTDADLDEYARCMAAPGGLRGGFAHYRALLADGKENKAALAGKKLGMPVLVLCGDHGIPLDKLAAGVKRAADRVTTGTVKDAGHWIAEENPADLARQLRAFFEAP